ncbi:SDR family NAD(P)-dependent oxidoreductase [Dankookia sp. P2]|uniref:SDR family NAD(P)-dependent oxidoreductase n=1 Tax=Dankookia sp. P2 TaxID=3423955 RepID=UPI003D671B27
MADRKVLLVTGGGRGIGAAVVRLASARGWDVAFTYAGNAARAAETEAAAKAAGAQVLAMQADVGEPQAVAATFAATWDRFGRLNALVNNAGITGSKATLRESTHVVWETVFRTNVLGLAACCRAALAMLPAGGAIVNVSSRASEIGGQGNGFITPLARARLIP